MKTKYLVIGLKDDTVLKDVSFLLRLKQFL